MRQAGRPVDASVPKQNRDMSKVQEEKVASSKVPFDAGQVAREETLRLVQRIFLQQTQNAPRTVVFAAVSPGTGCSQVCLLVAEAIRANFGGSVCVVEANFRSPALPGLLGTTNHYGLTEALLQPGPIRSFAKPVHSDNLWLLSSGSVDPGSPSLLTGDRIKARFDELRAEFDYVLVDAPPLSRYEDAMILGRITDGVVLVLEAVTRKEAVLRLIQNLRTSQITVLGAVLNNCTLSVPEPRSIAAGA